MGDEKLLRKARLSPHDWSPDEVVALLSSFGFVCWEGKKHTVCRHPKDPNVYHTIPRHRRVRSYVVKAAVRLIDATRGEGGTP